MYQKKRSKRYRWRRHRHRHRHRYRSHISVFCTDFGMLTDDEGGFAFAGWVLSAWSVVCGLRTSMVCGM